MVSTSILFGLPLNNRKRHYLLVAISEGFTNAFLHGNQKEPKRNIAVIFEMNADFLKVIVEDEGVLPIQNNIDELVKPVDENSESGRGLSLIKRLVDEANLWHEPEKGNILVMKTFFDKENNTTQVEVRDGYYNQIS